MAAVAARWRNVLIIRICPQYNCQYPGGTVPPNPTELLARDGLDKAIETLKKNFDYVILDTAPVGMNTYGV